MEPRSRTISPLEETGLLLELSREVTGTLDLQEVLDRSLAALRRLIDFDGGSIQLVEEGCLMLAATDPPATPEAKTVRIPVGQGVGGTIAATGEPCYIPDILADPRVHPEGHAKATSPGVRSWFGAPLILHGKPIGVVQIDSRAVDAFPPEVRALVLAFVPTVTAAVQNAQLFNREVEALNELREAERLKSDLLAVVSHELRTPLTSVSGFAETLAQRAREIPRDLIQEFGLRIWEASRRLERLIEDLLDLSQIERGILKVDLAPTAVGSLIGEMALSLGAQAHPVLVTVEPGLPPVLADVERLRQILVNLLDNARKFSPAGEPIEVRADLDGDRVAVSVQDRGKGIPAGLLDKVFDRFFQIDPAATRAAGGLGIGLYLVRELCDLMGAEIQVESGVGKGSRFTVRLPPAVAGGGPPQQADVPAHAEDLSVVDPRPTR